MSQLVISNIEGEILAISLQKQRNQINEIIEAIERDDISTEGIKTSIKSIEENLRILRKSYFLARP